MGFVSSIAMVIAGGGVALLLFILALRKRGEATPVEPTAVRPDRESIEASILHEILLLGGIGPEDAREFLSRELNVSAPVIQNIDLQNWGEEYGRRYGSARAVELLATAVRAAVMTASVVPLAQYNALLDLCFRLGLQTDSLARLRAQYRFVYVDHARQRRPRSADRLPRRRSGLDTNEMMGLLELDGELSRHRVTSAYRRLAAQCHPDRFHDASPEEQRAGAERFIRLTEAYEALLPVCPDE